MWAESHNHPWSYSLKDHSPLLLLCKQGRIQNPSDLRAALWELAVVLLPPVPLRGCYLRLTPKRAVWHLVTPRAWPQAGSVERDPVALLVGGKQQNLNLGGAGRYWLWPGDTGEVGRGPALLAVNLRLATATQRRSGNGG